MGPIFTFIFAFLFSVLTFAGGKLVLEPYKVLDKSEVSYKYGLSIDQALGTTASGGLYYSGWIGADMDQVADTEDYSVKNGLRVQILKLSVEPGIQFSKTKGSEYTEEKLYIKVGYQLW